jgi:hypothetical protein
MTDQTHVTAYGITLGRQVVSEHARVSAFDGHETGTGPQQRGLASPVRPAQQDDLATIDRERRTGQGRKRAEHHHDVAHVDHMVVMAAAEVGGDIGHHRSDAIRRPS